MKEEYKQRVRNCRNSIRKVKAGNELRIAREAKKAFLRYTQNKRNEKEKGFKLLKVDGRVITDDKEKAEVLSSYFTSVFSHKEICNQEEVQVGSSLETEECNSATMMEEYILQKAGLDESHARIKNAGRNINNLRYTDDTTLMAESEEELKSLLMQITADIDCSQDIKRHLLLGRKVMANLDSILKSRDITLQTKLEETMAHSLCSLYAKAAGEESVDDTSYTLKTAGPQCNAEEREDYSLFSNRNERSKSGSAIGGSGGCSSYSGSGNVSLVPLLVVALAAVLPTVKNPKMKRMAVITQTAVEEASLDMKDKLPMNSHCELADAQPTKQDGLAKLRNKLDELLMPMRTRLHKEDLALQRDSDISDPDSSLQSSVALMSSLDLNFDTSAHITDCDMKLTDNAGLDNRPLHSLLIKENPMAATMDEAEVEPEMKAPMGSRELTPIRPLYETHAVGLIQRPQKITEELIEGLLKPTSTQPSTELDDITETDCHAPWVPQLSSFSPQVMPGHYYKVSSDVKVAQVLLEQKKSYKQLLIQKKKEAWKKNSVKLIQAAKSKDSSMFWWLIKISPTCRPTMPDCYIHLKVWEMHFHELYKELDAAHVTWNTVFEGVLPWPPVLISEIYELAAQMKMGKDPGEDLIPPKVVKNKLEWWTPVLVSLFSYIDMTRQIPADWSSAIIVLIFKKGKRHDPTNYRPISLLSIIGLKKRTRKAFGIRKKEKDTDSTHPALILMIHPPIANQNVHRKEEKQFRRDQMVLQMGFIQRLTGKDILLALIHSLTSAKHRFSTATASPGLVENERIHLSLMKKDTASDQKNQAISFIINFVTIGYMLFNCDLPTKGKHFYSSSESEEEEEAHKKFNIKIKPLQSKDILNSAATVDELKASIGNIALSPSPVWLKCSAFRKCTQSGAKMPSTDTHSLCRLCLREGYHVDKCVHCQLLMKQACKNCESRLKKGLWDRALIATKEAASGKSAGPPTAEKGTAEHSESATQLTAKSSGTVKEHPDRSQSPTKPREK
ncbi:SH3-containing GRB2-like protein 3-interacting protein 1 [Varanus komodoensis]|nr:SH3-containing GRB2-like protein 3-interacting protein 1 [Varanus komodoensis]